MKTKNLLAAVLMCFTACDLSDPAKDRCDSDADCLNGFNCSPTNHCVAKGGAGGGSASAAGGGSAAMGGGSVAMGGGTAAMGGGVEATGGGTAAMGGGTAAMGGGSATGGGSVTPSPALIGTFHDGVWSLDFDGDKVFNIAIDRQCTFGQAGDLPVTGDWTGTGVFRIGVFRNVGGVGHFLLDLNGDCVWDDAVDRTVLFGMTGDQPVAGDWTGTGVTRVGVYRPALNAWYLDIDGNGGWNPPIDRSYGFGQSSAVPVTGDWTHTGKAYLGLFTPAAPNNALWSIDVNGNGTWDQGTDWSVSFGLAADKPITGDWNGDGRSKIATYRNGIWSFDTDGDNVYDATTTFGSTGDIPVVLGRKRPPP